MKQKKLDSHPFLLYNNYKYTAARLSFGDLTGKENVMKRRLAIFWSWHKKAVIGFGIYYVVFLCAALWGAAQGWSLRMPMIVLVLMFLLVSIGGPEDHLFRRVVALRDPMVAEDLPAARWDLEGIPFLGTLALVAPPALWLAIDILF